jgi:hypothetical protein
MGFASSHPSAQDAEESKRVLDTFLSRYHNPKLKSDQQSDVSTYYRRPGNQYHTLIIYEITNRTEQNEIISVLREIRSELKSKPIKVDFMEGQNLHTEQTIDGGQLTTRGREKLLRSVMIK